MLVVTELFNIAVNYFDTKKCVRYSWVFVVSRTYCIVITPTCDTYASVNKTAHSGFETQRRRHQKNTNLSDNVDTRIELRRLPDNLAAPPVALATSSRSVQVQLFDCMICTSPLQLYNNISLIIRKLTSLCVNHVRLQKSTVFIKMSEINSFI